MTVVLTGHDLSREAMLRVARDGEAVALEPAVLDRMAAARAVVEERLAAGDPIYGASTGVGVLKRTALDAVGATAYAGGLIRQHQVGQGEPAPVDVVRATMLRLANAFAAGYPGVRPALAERLVAALNAGEVPRVRTLGSVGQADLAPMADLAAGLLNGVVLEAGEGLALVSGNAFSTAAATLAVHDTDRLIATMGVAGALSLEGLLANPSAIHPGIGAARPYPGLVEALERLNGLLAESPIHTAGQARSLQDPLTFRNLPQLLGACLGALAHVDEVLKIELNASQGNPIVLLDERRLISTANFEIVPLAAAVDYLRIVLATGLGTSAERSVKLLEQPWSGLPTGLAASGDPADPGLSYLGIAAQSIAAEARLLAAPVSFELVSTAHAEGIEDRTSLAPLGARRLSEMVELGARVIAIELAVAAEAWDRRGLIERGAGTARAAALVRQYVPGLAEVGVVPDVEPLVRAVARGELAFAGS